MATRPSTAEHHAGTRLSGARRADLNIARRDLRGDDNADKHGELGRGRIALMVAHCAGMVDLVALPVWVGALIAQYGFSPAQAGGLATLFLIGAVVSSLFFAPRFNRIDARLVAAAGFALAACRVLSRPRCFPASRPLLLCHLSPARPSAAR